MGLYDREYYREESSSSDAWLHGRAVFGIITFTCILYFLQLVSKSQTGQDQFLEIGGYELKKVMGGEVWRLFFAPFLHDPNNLVFVVFNMLMLYMFAHPLEELIGSKEVLCLYLASAVLCQFMVFLLDLAGIGRAGVYGSSGAMAAIVTLFVFRFPDAQLPLVRLPFWPLWALILLESLLSLLANRVIIFNSHPVLLLSGALFGFLYQRSGVSLTHFLPSMKQGFRFKRRPKLRVLPMENPVDTDVDAEPITANLSGKRAQGSVDEQLEAKLDFVLEKVARLGKQSLSAEENEILLRASEIYKKRRGN